MNLKPQTLFTIDQSDYPTMKCLGCNGKGFIYIFFLGKCDCEICKGTGRQIDYNNIWPNSPLKYS